MATPATFATELDAVKAFVERWAPLIETLDSKDAALIQKFVKIIEDIDKDVDA